MRRWRSKPMSTTPVRGRGADRGQPGQGNIIRFCTAAERAGDSHPVRTEVAAPSLSPNRTENRNAGVASRGHVGWRVRSATDGQPQSVWRAVPAGSRRGAAQRKPHRRLSGRTDPSRHSCEPELGYSGRHDGRTRPAPEQEGFAGRCGPPPSPSPRCCRFGPTRRATCRCSGSRYDRRAAIALSLINYGPFQRKDFVQARAVRSARGTMPNGWPNCCARGFMTPSSNADRETAAAITRSSWPPFQAHGPGSNVELCTVLTAAGGEADRMREAFSFKSGEPCGRKVIAGSVACRWRSTSEVFATANVASRISLSTMKRRWRGWCCR